METNMFADTHFKIRHAEDERHFLANSWDSGAGYLIYLPWSNRWIIELASAQDSDGSGTIEVVTRQFVDRLIGSLAH